MHHLLPIRPVKLEWLIGVAYLPVPVCVLRRGRVQSFSPSPAPPQPGGVGKHEKLKGIKNVSLCNKSWFVHYQEVPLLWWNNRASEEEKAEENPLAEAEQNFKPCWVPVLFVGRALSLTSDSLSLSHSPVSRPPQHAGLALSPLFDIFICSAKATGRLACELSMKVDYSPCLSPHMTYLKQNNCLTFYGKVITDLKAHREISYEGIQICMGYFSDLTEHIVQFNI